MRGNIITMHMARGRVTRAGNLYQYDYGQKLVFAGVSLPAAYEVHFSNQERGQSKTMIGDETGVVIPDEYLTTGEPVHVWVYLHDGEDDGETEYHGIIGVTKRAEPTDQEPTPEQQSVIDQAIAALNSGITEVEEIAAGIPSAIGDAFGEITADAETLQPEDDATASFDSETKKLTIGVPRGAKGNPGDPGAPGYSPSAKVTKSGKTATITITDANGTTSETVSDGDPTTLIDDNSGSGATAKTWSANKLTTELAKKYEKPNSGIPASDMAAGVIPDISGKADKVTRATSGNFAGLDSNGNLTDSGKKPSDFLTEHQDISGKADKSEIGTVPEGETVEGQISDLLQAINAKQTAPASGAAAGKVLGLALVDGQLVPVWDGFPVSDVQVNGTSILGQGVANIPYGDGNGVFGVVSLGSGLKISSTTNKVLIDAASEANIKLGSQNYFPIVPVRQHVATFYGLAKAAGDSTQSASGNTVGTYTESAKSAISQMLDAPETVSGTTPSITAKAGVRYVCGEVSTLTIVAPASGCIDVTFTSGSTATVLTVSSAKTGVTAIKWANGFDPSSLDANTVYEINILDGEYGVALAWT